MSTKNTTNVEEIYTELLKHVGLRTYTDLAKFFEVKYPTLMRWKERGNVADIAPFVAKIPTININWLTTGEGPMFTDGEHAKIDGALPSLSGSLSHRQKNMQKGRESDYTVVPMAAINGSAGPGAIVDGEEVEDLLAFRTTWLKSNVSYDVTALSCIRVEGDSMEPTISNGDVVLVDHHAKSFDGVCAINLDGLLMVKRLQRMPSGKILVKSDNPGYDEIEVSEDNGVSLIVIGQVVWLGRSF